MFHLAFVWRLHQLHKTAPDKACPVSRHPNTNSPCNVLKSPSCPCRYGKNRQRNKDTLQDIYILYLSNLSSVFHSSIVAVKNGDGRQLPALDKVSTFLLLFKAAESDLRPCCWCANAQRPDLHTQQRRASFGNTNFGRIYSFIFRNFNVRQIKVRLFLISIVSISLIL